MRLGVRRDGLPLRLGRRAGHPRDRPAPPGALEACVALGLDGVPRHWGRPAGLWETPAGGGPGAAGGASRWGRGRVRDARRARCGASSTGAAPEGSHTLAGPGRSPRAAGMGHVSSVACPWRTRTGVSTWQRAGCWASTRASEPRQRPRRLPPPQPQRPRVSPRPSSAWPPAGVPVPPPRPGTAGPPTAPLALAGAPRAWGSRQPPPKRPRRGRPPPAAAPQVEGRSRLGVRPAALLPSAEAQGWTGLATPCGQRRRRMSRGSRRSRPNLARWHRAVAGARLPPRAVPCGGSTPNGRRPGPGSRSWGAACRRSSTGTSACLSATMRRTSLGSKAQRRRPPRPWSAPSLPRERWCHGLWGISQAARAMASRTIICSSARPWVLSRPGISAWPQSKMHGRVPHPLERGLRRFYSHRPHPP